MEISLLAGSYESVAVIVAETSPLAAFGQNQPSNGPARS